MIESPIVRIPVAMISTVLAPGSWYSIAISARMGTIRRFPVMSYKSTTPSRNRPDPTRFRIM